ncbi:MAG: antitoxin [Sciscionella sp.]|nr:antitoxin [Sciscionella sp.]
MATIQIRNIPDDAYETLRRSARSAGKSLQAYMRDEVVDLARRRTVGEALDAVEAAMAAEDSPGATVESILEDLRITRGE